MVKNPTISDNLAEAGIIATLIYNPTYIVHGEQLKHTHFYNKESACLYWGINQLIKQGVENIDSFNLITVINSNEGIKNTFDKFGIDLDSYIELSRNVARDSIEEYKVLVNRVLALAFKRDLYKQLKKYNNICLDVNDDDVNKLSSDIFETLNKLNERYILNDDIKPISEQVDDLWEEVLARRTTDGYYGYKFKIDELNKYCTAEPGELFLVVSSYKQGKSMYLMNELIYQIQNGLNVTYLDTEMPTRQMFERLLGHLAQVDVRKIKVGNYAPSEEERIKEARDWLKKTRFFHVYNPRWNFNSIFATVKMAQYKKGMNMLFYDYIKSDEATMGENYNKLGAIASFLKNDIAGGLNIPVITACQTNRQNQIGDSIKLARYSSVILDWREKSPEEMFGDWKKVGNFRIRVVNNRLGEQMDDENDYISVVFDKNKATIKQAPEQEHENINI